MPGRLVRPAPDPLCPSLVLHIHTPFESLRAFFQFRSDLADVTGMGNGTVLIRDDGNGETYEGELFVVPSVVDGVDVATQSIVAIIKIRDDEVESFDCSLADSIDRVWTTHEHKVIAADVAHEPFRSGQFPNNRRQNAARNREYFVASSISIAIVEGLKIVDVGIGQGEGLPTFDSGRRLEGIVVFPGRCVRGFASSDRVRRLKQRRTRCTTSSGV